MTKDRDQPAIRAGNCIETVVFDVSAHLFIRVCWSYSLKEKTSKKVFSSTKTCCEILMSDTWGQQPFP